MIFSVADPDSGMGKKSRSGSGVNILDHISESLTIIFWVKIRIRDKHTESATLGFFKV
jgi:hypothetical protein